MEGWIILERKITEHWVWEDAKFAYRWIDLLMGANYANAKRSIGSQLVMCKRGELITTREALARRWKTSPSSVGRFLHLLAREGMIRLDSGSRMTHITICHYDRYQSPAKSRGAKTDEQRMEAGTLLDPKRRTDDLHLKERKENNERKEDKTNDSIESSSSKDDAVTDDVLESLSSFFNELIHDTPIPPIKVLRGRRRAALQARLRDYGEDVVRTVLSKSAESSFLTGGGERGWFASFDWIIKPQNFLHILEGRYDSKRISEKIPKTASSSAQERDRRAAEERERAEEERRRKDEEEEKRRKSVDNIVYHYLRFGGEAWRQAAIDAGLDIEELDRQRGNQ